MDLQAPPRCPDCGFQVFNRRYPKCESCGAELPESLVYTAVERHAQAVAEEERSLEKAKQDLTKESVTTPGSLDDAVVSAVMGLSET